MITVEEVTRTYGDYTPVDDVTFTAEPGRVTGFLGPNGAGKSTTMHTAHRPTWHYGKPRRRAFILPRELYTAVFRASRAGQSTLRLSDTQEQGRRR